MPGSSRSALFISAMPSTPSIRTMSSTVIGVRATGTTALVRMGLSSGPADPRQHRHQDQPDRDPQQQRVRAQQADAGAERGQLGDQDHAAEQPHDPDVLVQQQPFLRVARRDRQMTQVGLFRHPPPADLRDHDAGEPDHGPRRRGEQPPGRPDAVIRRMMPRALRVPAGGLLDALPGAQVLGDDRLPLARLAALRLGRGGRRSRAAGRPGARHGRASTSASCGSSPSMGSSDTMSHLTSVGKPGRGALRPKMRAPAGGLSV